MRTIKGSEELNTLVKAGDIVRLEGFTDEPVIAIVTERTKRDDCSGCVLDTEVSCSVTTRNNKGEPVRISLCCIRPTWMDRKGIPKFGRFNELNKVLEDL